MGTMCATCSCTCTDLELSGMLPHGTRGILSHDSQKSKPQTPLGIQANVHSLFQINKLPGDQSLFFSSFTTMGPAETHIKESTQLPGTSLDQKPECGTKQFQIHTWGPKQIQIGPQTNPYKAGNKSRLGQSGHYKLPREAPEQGTQRTTTRQRSKFLLPRCWGGARGVVGGGARREAPRSLPLPAAGHWGSKSRDSSRKN